MDDSLNFEAGVSKRESVLEEAVHGTAKQIQQKILTVKASDSLIDYLQRLVQFTRTDGAFQSGLSPRGALALLQSARAWAWLHDRNYVIPEDVQAVMPSVVGHRLRGSVDQSGYTGTMLVQHVLNAVDII